MFGCWPLLVVGVVIRSCNGLYHEVFHRFYCSLFGFSCSFCSPVGKHLACEFVFCSIHAMMARRRWHDGSISWRIHSHPLSRSDLFHRMIPNSDSSAPFSTSQGRVLYDGNGNPPPFASFGFGGAPPAPAPAPAPIAPPPMPAPPAASAPTQSNPNPFGTQSLDYEGGSDPNAKTVRLRDRLKEADVERRKDEEAALARERAAEIRREERLKKIAYMRNMPDNQPAGTGTCCFLLVPL